MATRREHEEARNLLARCVRACAGYGGDFVIAGRMALELYRLHPEMRASDQAEATREVDVVVPRRLSVKGRPVAALLEDEGLVAHDSLALDHRRRGKRVFQDKSYDSARTAPTFVEFLTPKIGESDGIVAPQPELYASALRFVDLMLFEPLVVELNGVDVHVATPSMFIAQKVLMRDSRSRRRVDKDLVSIYEACLLSEPRWTAERGIVKRARAHDSTWSEWLARPTKLLRAAFHDATSNASVAVATALRGHPRAPDAAVVARVVADAVAAIFD